MNAPDKKLSSGWDLGDEELKRKWLEDQLRPKPVNFDPLCTYSTEDAQGDIDQVTEWREDAEGYRVPLRYEGQ